MERKCFDETFPSKIECVGAMLNRAVGVLLERKCIEPDREFHARLCLEEAIMNAVTHANRCDAALTVRLEICEAGDHCVLKVYDQGPGFCVDDVDEPDTEQMGGRGILLIRHCTAEVRYVDSKRCLEMKIPRKAICGGGGTDE